MDKEITISERLRQLMDEHGVGENELARRSKVPQPTIHRILSGTSKSPRLSNLKKIAGALGTTATYLAHGEDETGRQRLARSILSIAGPIGAPISAVLWSYPADSKAKAPDAYLYPLMYWSDVQDCAEQFENSHKKQRKCEIASYSATGLGFWLQVTGDAMTAPMGGVPSISDGTLVLFDTGLPATLGKLVLAKITESSEPTFRKLIEDSGQRYLKPLNPAYPLILMENGCQILAVAVEAKTKL